MKDSLEHLPKPKQAELERVVKKICSYINPEMIILYGSYARGDYKEAKDIAPDSKSGHASDYDILVVTMGESVAEDAGLWHTINSECWKMKLSAHPKIIREDIEKLNRHFELGYYFYVDIKRDGIILYDTEKITLKDRRELTPQEDKKLVQEYYDHWFEGSQRFYRHFEIGMEEEDFKGAAFHLFMTAEACYKSILLVFTKYCPKEHHLGLIGELIFQFNVELKDIFPNDSQEHQQLFELLDYAYIGTRYDPKYTATKEQLEYLGNRVQRLRGITEKMCTEKIENL
ncbi:MAG: HEPN domain-containing protein [Phycisphaerae bacterium]|nr:HEPN domain-containing protein [Phycisphaerae bacterium]